MTSDQIHDIAARAAYPGQKGPAHVVETHISWVLLAADYAFKIKKPLQLSFLDFSTLEQRAHYCEEEVRLNRRLAPDMYLGVLAVQSDSAGQLSIGPFQQGLPLLDYAVWMRRMDLECQMDRRLSEHAVTSADMEALAERLAHFHRANVLDASGTPIDLAEEYRTDFEDLFALATVAERLLGETAISSLERWRECVRHFLDSHQRRLHERTQAGFWVEGHGDLHTGNIFLLPDGPVVFDCIEFDAHLRRLDVLNELAFLMMDLEARGHAALAETFFSAYTHHWPCLEGPEDERLLAYFKAYRANVRLKIALLLWEQHPQPDHAQSVRLYWDVLERYVAYL